MTSFKQLSFLFLKTKINQTRDHRGSCISEFYLFFLEGKAIHAEIKLRPYMATNQNPILDIYDDLYAFKCWSNKIYGKYKRKGIDLNLMPKYLLDFGLRGGILRVGPVR